MEKEVKKIHPAVIAVWAAVIAVGNYVPTVPILGANGTFSLSSALSPLSGIFFGPIAGALCTAIGGFTGNLIAPHTAWMGPFTFIVSTATAFTAGCIAWAKWPPVKINIDGNFIFNGAIIVYFIGAILWFTQEIGRSYIWLPVIYYGFGFIITITGIYFTNKGFASSNKWFKSLVMWLCAFGGLVGGSTVGNFFSLVIYKQPKEIWIAITTIAPIERIVFALGAAAIGFPLLEGLNKIGIPVGPGNSEQ